MGVQSNQQAGIAQTGAPVPAAASLSARPAGSMLMWRLASILIFCVAWEIAGRIPINVAFPPFSEVVAALWRITADGTLPAAFLNTLQPLVIGVFLATFVGIVMGVGMGLRQELEWAG